MEQVMSHEELITPFSPEGEEGDAPSEPLHI
jgi:hypothetical protein